MDATRPWVSIAAFLGPPVAWALHLMVVYPLVPLVCSTGHAWLFWVAHLAALALASAATVLAIRAHRGTAGRADLPARRARFLALLGIASGAFFLFAIVFESLPSVLQDPCL